LSFSSLHNLNRSVFDYFTFAETFKRIAEVKGDPVRLTYEAPTDASQVGRLLSCTKITKPLLRLPQVSQLVDEFHGMNATYAGGVVNVDFECPFPMEFHIGGDDFRTRFHLELPVDGFGLPAAYLAMLRLVCTNGLIGISRAFKTVFQLGREESGLDMMLRRVMATFSNEEGFHSFRNRVEAATRSWASLHEAMLLRKTLTRALTESRRDPASCAAILERLDKACGDPLAFYGLTNTDEISARRARTIPVDATVYDLVNFASEAATHHLSQQTARNRLNAWTGSLITGEYDLEGRWTPFRTIRTSSCRGAGPMGLGQLPSPSRTRRSRLLRRGRFLSRLTAARRQHDASRCHLRQGLHRRPEPRCPVARPAGVLPVARLGASGVPRSGHFGREGFPTGLECLLGCDPQAESPRAGRARPGSHRPKPAAPS